MPTQKLIKPRKRTEPRAGKPAKLIPIDHGKSVLLKKVQYSDEEVEKMFHLFSHCQAIHDILITFKGTEFYTASLEKELDKGASKFNKLFVQNSPGYISDRIFEGTKLFSRFCKFSYDLSLQPQPVLDRFERKYTDLLIEAGIDVINPMMRI